MKHIVLTIIFDSLIGNGDRHQENWGFIIPNTFLNEKIKNESIDSKIFRIFWNFIIGKKSKNDFIEEFKGKFSPIYDSGSCLGRELLDNKVDKMLADKQMLESYINRDKCELRCNDGRKISHFELIKKSEMRANMEML